MVDWFDDLAVGMRFKSQEKVVTREDIKRFAAVPFGRVRAGSFKLGPPPFLVMPALNITISLLAGTDTFKICEVKVESGVERPG